MGYAEVIKKAMAMLLEMIELAQRGVSKEDIFERMKQPGSVASDLIDAVQKREDDGSEFLGRS
jgi:mannitol/fructose-specific phosphotransferase system IIA component